MQRFSMSPASRGPLFLIVGTLGTFAFARAVLADLAELFLSRDAWNGIARALGLASMPPGAGGVNPELSAWLAAGIVLLSGVTWIAGGWLVKRRQPWSLYSASIAWADRGWRWWLLPAAWSVCWTAGLLLGSESGLNLLAATAPLWAAVAIAGWTGAWFSLQSATQREATGGRTSSVLPLVCLVGVFTVVFTAMNWGLWFNLRIPHGDSAMYEEHLWNLEHGKGFRSYLDQGLFLGEHIQVVHVLLVPLHLLWPSHLLLELCESLALASCAIPVYRIAHRHCGSRKASLLLAAATLLYVPLQFLDIAIDFKTFRPIAFGVPLFLWAIDSMELRRYGRMTLFLLLALSAKEDYAIVTSLLGLWMLLAARPWQGTMPEERRQAVVGAVVMVLGAVYLLVAVKCAIPWFRGGETVHYARYFEKFGETPGEILGTMLTSPRLMFGELINSGSLQYVLLLLVPLGGLPLRSPGRLAVGLPLLALLCLNTIAMQPPAPVHHFHAPLVPIVLWAAAAGLARWRTAPSAGDSTDEPATGAKAAAIRRARFACLCGLTTGLFLGFSPLSLSFWDPGNAMFWRGLYVPTERARQFETVDALIPADARVASTDFVHARLTHRERSYDYSDYPRAVSNYEDRVPHDTDWIVIDIEHPYHSRDKIRQLRKEPYRAVRELREHPEEWKLVEHDAGEYFIVLRRRTTRAAQ